MTAIDIRSALVVLVVGLVAAAGPRVPAHAQTPSAYREPANLAELEQAAAKEGRLDIAWGATYGSGDGAKKIPAGILRRFHVALQIEYSPVANGAAMQTQVAEEVRAGHVASSDVFFHVRDHNLAAAAQVADFRKYVPGLPESVQYFGKRSVVAVTVLESFIYNTQRIPPDRVPKGFADLLRLEWKGKIASRPTRGSSPTTPACPR